MRNEIVPPTVNQEIVDPPQENQFDIPKSGQFNESRLALAKRSISKIIAVAALICTATVGVETMRPAFAEADCCNANAQTAFGFFEGEGYSATQSAAWIGNLAQESNVDPTKIEPNGVGHGIAQWSEPGRWDTLVAYASGLGQSEWSLSLQLNFMEYELSGAYSSVASEVKATSDLTTATEDICVDYEGAATCGADNRVAYAADALSDYGSSGGGGTQMMLDSSGDVWAKNSIGSGGWTEEVSGNQTKISAGGGTQMMLDSSGDVWAKNSIGSGGWTEEASGGITAIATGDNGFQMILDSSGDVWAKNSIGSGGWTEEVSGGQAKISAGGGTQMMLDSYGDVWAKNTSSISNGGWTEEVSGGTTSISAGSSGFQMILDSSNDVWAKASIGSGGWTEEVTGNQTAISAG